MSSRYVLAVMLLAVLLTWSQTAQAAVRPKRQILEAIIEGLVHGGDHHHHHGGYPSHGNYYGSGYYPSHGGHYGGSHYGGGHYGGHYGGHHHHHHHHDFY